MSDYFKFTLIFAALALVAAGASAAAAGSGGQLTVIMYHRFGDASPISVDVDQFKRQVDYLRENDYNFQSLKQVEEHIETGRPFPPRSVLITVDDGYRSTYTEAYPYFKKHDIPWVLYVYTEAIEKGYGSSLTWAMIEEMAADSVPVENHTYSHGKIDLVDEKTDTWVEKELLAPHRKLKEKTGRASSTMAIPYGRYDRELVEILKNQTDYPFVMSSDPGVVDPEAQTFVLRRMAINRSTSWNEFLNKLNNLPLKVESARPRRGARLETTPDTMEVVLGNPGRISRGRLNTFISEFGAVDSRWQDAEAGRLVVDVPAEFTRRWNRLIVTGLDAETKKYRYYSQGIVFTGAE